jgi:hypothetical protein
MTSDLSVSCEPASESHVFAVTLEFIPRAEINTALVLLEPEAARGVRDTFATFLTDAGKWGEQAKTLVVTDISQKKEMKVARKLRLEIKAIRCEVEKIRKALGEQSLRRTQAINAVASLIKDKLEPIEAHLLEQEEFAERAEAKRLDALNAARRAVIAHYLADAHNQDFSGMTEEGFALILSDHRRIHEEKLEVERKAAEAKAAHEWAEAERIRQIEVDNARLKAEQAAQAAEVSRVKAQAKAEADKLAVAQKAKDDAAANERAAADGVAKAAREKAESEARAAKAAQERAEAEAKALRDAEAARVAAQAEANRKAALAPDREKVLTMASQIRGLALPQLTSTEGQAVSAKLADQIEKFALWVEKQAVGM